jgi:hypothetical protein
MSWRGLRACPSFEGAIRRQLTNGIKLDVTAAPLERFGTIRIPVRVEDATGCVSASEVVWMGDTAPILRACHARPTCPRPLHLRSKVFGLDIELDVRFEL